MQPDHAAQGAILFPDDSRIHNCLGLVLLHEPSEDWDYPCLQNFVVAIGKWSERELLLDGKMFYVCEEADVLAVFDPLEEFQPLVPGWLQQATGSTTPEQIGN